MPLWRPWSYLPHAVCVFVWCCGSQVRRATSSAVGDMRSCQALKLFQAREVEQAVPVLLNSDEHDYVAFEHVAAFYAMSARRLAGTGQRTSPATQYGMPSTEMAALRKAVFYFDKAWQGYQHWNKTTPGQYWDAVDYPQLKYAQPRELVFRAHGDALAWLGRTAAARDVYERGVRLELWKTGLCRPMPELPVRIDRSSPARYVVSKNNDDFEYVLKPLREKLMPTLSHFVKMELEARQTTAGSPLSARWKEESGGLAADSKSWYALTFAVNGQLKGKVPKRRKKAYAGDVESKLTYLKRTIQSLLEHVPGLNVRDGQMKLSLLMPGTHVKPHAGPTNRRLRVHCSILVPRLKDRNGNLLHMRVGNETQVWEDNECFVFDESCEHEVQMPSKDAFLPRWVGGKAFDPYPRVVFIVDIANILLKTEDLYITEALRQDLTPDLIAQARGEYRAFYVDREVRKRNMTKPRSIEIEVDAI
jgi:hypothetical protein